VSEHYKPRALYRAARARPFVAPIDRAAEERAAVELRRQTKSLHGARVIVDCTHGVPWLSCKLCSTTRRT
jgi:hypothetical protein